MSYRLYTKGRRARRTQCMRISSRGRGSSYWRYGNKILNKELVIIDR